jgi:hypothetical protein
MDRTELIRRAEAVAAADPWPGFITRDQMMALLREANWIKTPPVEPPDPRVGADIESVFGELHARGITFLKE